MPAHFCWPALPQSGDTLAVAPRRYLADVTDTDDLARALFRLETSTLTTAAMTAHITRAVVEWAAARGWVTRTEARVGVGLGE